jgi:ATP-binding cassette subfamily B protein
METKGKLKSSSLLTDFMKLRLLWPYIQKERTLFVIAVVLIPIISVLLVLEPLLLKYAIDEGVLNKDLGKLTLYSVGFLIVVTGEYLTRTGQSYTTAIIINRMISNLRRRLVSHVLSLRASYHDRSLSGALVTRATSDFDNLNESLSTGVLKSIVDISSLAGCIIGMFLLEWHLALIAVAVLPFVFWGIGWFSRALKTGMLASRNQLSVLNAYTQECLYGSSTIKLLAARKDAEQKYQQFNAGYRQAQMKVVVLDAFLFSVLDGVSSITIGLILWMTVTRLVGLDAITAGVMVAFIRYIQQVFEPLKQLGSTMAMLQGVFTAVDRVFTVLDTKEFIEGTDIPASISGSVEFKNVSFRYGKNAGSDQKLTLEDITFRLKPGESLALVGATGSGKSTIVKLLSKLYDGYDGKILLDGTDIRSLDGSLIRKQISIVPQDIVLFDGSVTFNISLGAENISLEDVKSAAKIVGADTFINLLPGGYDFNIREQGGNLSHGQTQLIAFARALARNPKLVILDEATSSVDPQSETVIQDAIRKMLHGRTVVVIAHRLSTIRECDKILVIGAGKILEEGNHQQLIKRGGAYQELHLALSH